MKKLSFLVLFIIVIAVPVHSPAQKTVSWKVEKMPPDLETKFALSSLPSHVRDNATVYLLDPEKGFYIARQGSNGYSCFVLRTDWQLGEFPQDFAAAISYDAEGTKAIFPVYADVEAMRASPPLACPITCFTHPILRRPILGATRHRTDRRSLATGTTLIPTLSCRRGKWKRPK
jgi:hypothetical protein